MCSRTKLLIMFKKIINLLMGILILSFVFIFGFYWFSYKISPIFVVNYLAAQAGSAIGISATVPPNPYNTIAQQLNKKEKELQEREKEINQKEKQIKEKVVSQNKAILWGLFSMTFILFVLILMNFYLDFKRKKSNQSQNENLK